MNRCYTLLQKEILAASVREAKAEIGEFELDESYFFSERGAASKTPVFGLLKRGEKVFVTMVPNCSRETLTLIIQGKILEKSTVIWIDGGLATASCSTVTTTTACSTARMNLRAARAT